MAASKVTRMFLTIACFILIVNECKYIEAKRNLGNDKKPTAQEEVSVLVRKVGYQYENLFARMNEMKNKLLEDSEAEGDEDHAKNFINEIETGERRISAVIKELNGVFKITDVSRIIVNGFNTTAFKDDAEKIRVSFGYLPQFREKTPKSWSYLFTPLLTILSSKKQQFEKDAREQLRKINKDNEKIMGSIGNAVEDYYRKKIHDTEIEKIISGLKDGSNMLSEWVDETCAGDRTWYRLPEQIKNAVFLFDSRSMVSMVDTFIKNGRSFMFLRVFGGVPFDICNSSWVSPLLTTKRHLDSLHGFMVFVRDVYRKSSEYDIQGFKNYFNYLNNLQRENNLQDFINNVRKFNYSTANFTLYESNEFYRRLLDEVVDKTLGSEVSYDCSEPYTLIVRGDFVKFSDFVEAENLKILCNFNVARLKVHALKVVFIDRDIKHPSLQLSIIAPVWDVIGSREINLDGGAGRAHEDPSAANGGCLGCDGSDGLAGLPGGPGGSFLGIGQKFNNSDYLVISARGGPGGPGQHGGVGGMGKPGQRAFFYVRDSNLGKVVYEEHGCRRNCSFSGEPGQRGGNGGKGGVGGLGGRSGNITVISLGGSFSAYSIRKENGLVGWWGKDGRGAMGGLDGRDLFFAECLSPWSCPKKDTFRDKNTRGECGRNGIPGVSTIGLQQPEEGTEPPSITDNVRGYKHYLRQNLHDYFKTSSLLEFINALDNNPEIQNTVDYQTLQNEFLDLEKQGDDQRLHNYLSTFYESLLERTNQYAENPKDYDQSNTEALKDLDTRLVDKVSN